MSELDHNTNGDINGTDEKDTSKVSNLETDFQEALDRLDDVKLEADLHIDDLPPEGIDEEEGSPDSRSLGKESVTSDTSSKTSGTSNGNESPQKSISVQKNDKSGKTPSSGAIGKEKSKFKGSVFSKLRRLTKADKGSRKSKTSGFEDVKVDKLPQVFVAKYLGKKDSKGLSGLHNVRRPVDKLVGNVKKELEEKDIVELPLVYVVISSKGIDIREHKANKIKDVVPCGLIPIDFVSYGVQDMKYWRVFTFIAIKELSSRSRTTECHVIMCDKPENARKMALSLGAAFNVYKKQLQSEGKSHNFQVELRAPDELAAAYVEDEEC